MFIHLPNSDKNKTKTAKIKNPVIYKWYFTILISMKMFTFFNKRVAFR